MLEDAAPEGRALDGRMPATRSRVGHHPITAFVMEHGSIADVIARCLRLQTQT